MRQDEFQQLAKQGYDQISVNREIVGDLDTPLSIYLKVAQGPYS